MAQANNPITQEARKDECGAFTPTWATYRDLVSKQTNKHWKHQLDAGCLNKAISFPEYRLVQSENTTNPLIPGRIWRQPWAGKGFFCLAVVQNTLLSSILFDTAGMRVEKQDHKDMDAAGTLFSATTHRPTHLPVWWPLGALHSFWREEKKTYGIDMTCASLQSH